MADPRFFPAAGPLRLSDIATAAEARCDGDGERLFTGVAPLQSATPDEISFLDNRRYAPALRESRAGAVVLHPDMAVHLPSGCIGLVTERPYLGFARVALLFNPGPAPRGGTHPTAVVGPDAAIGADCEIGPYAVIGARAEIGARSIIGPHAVVGEGVVLGPDCRLDAHTSISHCIAGAGVVLHSGARVGTEGFGFATTATGEHVTMPQLGRVLLGDRVEIGTNSTVDRGSQGDTILGPGTRLDNQVQIGHNVKIGRGCIIVAQAGISGSTVVGDFVVIAAQAGIIGHATIGEKARIGAQAGVIGDVAPGADMLGSPAWPARVFWRGMAEVRRLGQPAARKRGKTDETP